MFHNIKKGIGVLMDTDMKGFVNLEDIIVFISYLGLGGFIGTFMSTFVLVVFGHDVSKISLLIIIAVMCFSLFMVCLAAFCYMQKIGKIKIFKY